MGHYIQTTNYEHDEDQDVALIDHICTFIKCVAPQVTAIPIYCQCLNIKSPG